ncbi:MAG TPA: NAD(P)-binding domain-containing protein, partial [Tepidisphaeraceae bacterium]|nr:NAD(P)-binding domain-containing protein [Tepidisphaeraceae bacterium]
QHFDAKQIGYTISWFAPQTRFFSSNERIAIAGVPLMTADQSKASREEYLAYLRSVVTQFDLKIHTYEPLVAIDRRGDGFALTTRSAAGERTTVAKKVVLVTGGTDHPRRLNIPGEDLPHVSHYFRDPHTYFGKRVLIVGGKNSAVEAALRCYNAGANVAMSYRKEMFPEKSIKYWLLPEINGLIQSKKIEGHFHTEPVKITPSQVTLCRNNETFDIAADFVLLLIGYRQDNKLFKLAGVELSEDCGAPKFDEQTMETNVPGIYVAGTAVGGTQDKYRVFIENCHVHVERILAALTGSAPPPVPAEYTRPES